MIGLIFFILFYVFMFMMGLMVFNCYMSIMKWIFYKKLFFSKSVVWMCCVFIWLFFIFFVMFFLIGWVSFLYDEKFNYCKLSLYVYLMFIGVVFINGVMIVMFYCYYKIYSVVKESMGNLNVYVEGSGVYFLNDFCCFNIFDVKVLKVCFIVVCFFVMMWCLVFIVVGIGILSFVIG